MTYAPAQRLTAEFVGTALLLAVVVGSGIMGDRLTGDDALALLANTVATGAGLTVLILIFGPISGAHFNPAVTFSFLLRREITLVMALLYMLVQVGGAVSGVWLAHLMFNMEILQVSITARDTLGERSAEAVATFALVFTILAAVRFAPKAVPYAVGLIITAGYWYTSSTSFANPAVTIARMLTDTFAGIAPASAPYFIAAEFLGAVAATLLASWLLVPRAKSS